MTPRQFSIASAKDQLPRLVHAAERGRPVELTRRGKPVAVILSRSEYDRLTGARPSFKKALADFLADWPADGDGIDDAFVERLRERRRSLRAARRSDSMRDDTISKSSLPQRST